MTWNCTVQCYVRVTCIKVNRACIAQKIRDTVTCMIHLLMQHRFGAVMSVHKSSNCTCYVIKVRLSLLFIDTLADMYVWCCAVSWLLCSDIAPVMLGQVNGPVNQCWYDVMYLHWSRYVRSGVCS